MADLPSTTSPITFREVPVPVEVEMRLGIVRSWKPSHGRDFRLVMNDKGQLAIFPTVKLSEGEKAAIVALAAEITGTLR